MFTKLSPQKVKHSDGYIVQVANRFAVEYLSENITASVSVDFGMDVGVYCNTLRDLKAGGIISGDEGELVISRIIAGLEAMGCKVERC
jgi:hypothetical protein